MKITVEDMINDYYGGDRKKVAERAGVSVYQVNNWVSQKRNVLMLHNGGFVLDSDKVKIINKP